MSAFELETFAVGALQCNCTLLMNPETKCAMVVDPGDEPFRILERLDYHEMAVTALWHTHAHFDHIGATKALWEILSERNAEAGRPAPVVYLHEADRLLYENVALQTQLFGMPSFEVPKNFTPIQDQQSYAGFEGLRALHTPGHTEGSCCLRIKGTSNLSVPRSYRVGGESGAPSVVLSGDTLFRGSIGRTDLPGGNSVAIIKSIRNRLLSLAPESLVVPGHGPLTTVEQEAAQNPFLR